MLMQTQFNFTEIAPEMTLSHLGKQARRAGTLVDLGFVLVHETHLLLPYRQAALWLNDEGITALSGGVSPQQGSCVQWLKRWCQSHPVGSEPVAWDLRQAARGDDEWKSCLSPWSPWLMAVPLPDAESGEVFGVLLLARETPCSREELFLLNEWIEAWAKCYVTTRRSAWHWPSLQEMKQWGWKTRTAVTAVIGLLGLYSGEKLMLAHEKSMMSDELAIIAPWLDGMDQKARGLPSSQANGRLSQVAPAVVPSPLQDKPAKWVVSAR